ncbi:MAG: translocation/assembly module TamB domain-containing protein, partial [Candidatus Eiseniibacteriota bacterium]
DGTLRVDGLELGDLNALLPEQVEVGGRLDIELASEGALDDLPLDGRIEGHDVELSLEQGSEVVVTPRIDVGGTARRPRLQGSIEILKGNIQIPESSRKLHPTGGEALLWSQTALTPPHAQQGVAAPATRAAARKSEELGGFFETPEIDIDVSTPGTLWIAGRGLRAELRGALAVTVDRGTPVLSGTLTAEQGTFKFMGRQFNVARGTVEFYGDDATDPTLDLVLDTYRDDVRIILTITGTAQRPELELSSEPSMSETEVLSQLVFGDSAGSLDRSQTDFLQSQALGAAQKFALPRLEEALTQELGIDVLRIQRQAGGADRGSETEPGGTSVLVGQYLSPRVLLKYEQGLDSVDDAQINVEYWIGEGVKLETSYGRTERSGIAINWTSTR